ncbi:S66 peptidase family protein [Fulvivirga ligni]|uniref:S66 peptidase family protein n=1 Tax=Fulvivirga ligni TaxID=2904246 RepID=UPI001F32EAE2|nr:LD-carboxypeptidase [Fulvivirga ligni]UII23590.1 LD-carboxypeptidase [Fulvivirga ligni]
MTSRRNFIGGAAILSLAPAFNLTAKERFFIRSEKIIKPPKLKQGDVVGLISPSGVIHETEPYEIAIETLQSLGFKVKPSEHLYDRYGYLAGTDQDRADEINSMFRDKEIKAIFCIRGGAGAARILDLLDYELIRKNPKVMIGYSDITALLLAIYVKTGLVSFHGPVATSDWNDFTLDSFKRILFQGEAITFTNPTKRADELVQTEDRIRTIHPGKASGVLVGGNLSVLSALVGSAYLPDWKGKILFLEDVGEEMHRIDRMMSQLKLAGILDVLSGFVFGKCSRCTPVEGYGSLTFEEVIDHYIKPLGIPAYSGAMIGHISKKFTIPVGCMVEVDASNGTIEMKESAVI